MNAGPKAAIGRLAARFDALTQRERGLLAVAIVVVLTLAGKGLLVDPAFARLAVEERRVAQQKKDLALAESTLQSVRVQLSADPDAALKTRLAGLAAEVAASEAQLQSLEGRLVQPERMNELLDRMLARHSGLRLLAFKSLPPVDLALPPQPAQPQGTKAASAVEMLKRDDFERALQEMTLDGHDELKASLWRGLTSGTRTFARVAALEGSAALWRAVMGEHPPTKKVR